MPHENRARVSRAPWRFLLAMVALLATAAGIALMTTGGASAATPTPISTPPPASSSNASPTLVSTPKPPGPVTNLTATTTSTSVTLHWTKPQQGQWPIVGYNIGYFPAFSDYGHSLSVGDVDTVTVPLSPATQYSFTIQARDSNNTGGPSASIVVITPATDSGPDTVPPAAPAKLTLGQVTATTAALSWTPSTDNVGVVGYQVWLFDGFFGNTLLATVTGTSFTASLTYTYTGDNQFYIRAKDAAGNVSIASNLVYTKALPSYSPSARPSPSSIPDPTVSCRAAYQVQSQWNTGFVANITIYNTGTAPISGWVLTFTFNGDQRITNGWNGIVAQTGSAVSVTNYGWNSTIPANGSVSVGFQGSWQTSNAAPSNFAINGVPCGTVA